jgi:hypothetical protein
MQKLLYVLNRLQEPSSHQSLLLLAGYFSINPIQLDNWLHICITVVGILGVFCKEGSPESRTDNTNTE